MDSSGMPLSQEQIDRYHADGFLVLRGVLDGAEVAGPATQGWIW